MGLIFASGAVLGVFGIACICVAVVAKPPAPRPNPEEFRKKIVAEYRESRLQAHRRAGREAQRIMDETRARVEEIPAEDDPAYQKIHEEQTRKSARCSPRTNSLSTTKCCKERQDTRSRADAAARSPGPRSSRCKPDGLCSTRHVYADRLRLLLGLRG